MQAQRSLWRSNLLKYFMKQIIFSRYFDIYNFYSLECEGWTPKYIDTTERSSRVVNERERSDLSPSEASALF